MNVECYSLTCGHAAATWTVTERVATTKGTKLGLTRATCDEHLAVELDAATENGYAATVKRVGR